MIVVIPVCPKDIDAALRNLAWCSQLNPTRQPFTCLVAHERNYGPSGSVVEAARKCFTEVSEFVYPPYMGVGKWPQPQNYAFRNVCLHMTRFGQPWLWWEQDAVLLYPDALTRIRDEYARCGKPFMGALGATDQPHGPKHLNGVAVYPAEACRLAQSFLISKLTPFDVQAGPRVMPSAHISPLFQHVWSWYGPKSDVPPNFTEAHLDKINPDAVIFHRCKDSSLIELLAIRTTTGQANAPKPKASLIQTLMRWKHGSGRWTIGLRKQPKALSVKSGPRIVHCVERHKQKDPDADRRVEQAQDSWVTLYRSGSVIPAHVWDYVRTSEQIGDSRQLPFLKDILVAGLNGGGRHDYVMLTNDDTILHPGIIERLMAELKDKPAVCSFRINFNRGQIPRFDTAARMVEASARLVPRGDLDLGRDMFAFRKDWLRDVFHMIPDFLLGELEWDLVLAYLIRRDAGVQTTKFNMDKLMPETEIEKGYVLHERHDRQWTSNQFESSAGKQWNRKLATSFYCDNDMHFLITNKV